MWRTSAPPRHTSPQTQHRRWTGAPGSRQRTWAENDGRSPTSVFAQSMNGIPQAHTSQTTSNAFAWCRNSDLGRCLCPRNKKRWKGFAHLFPPMYAQVFSSMTSFTKCLQRSFTLRRKRSERLGAQGDGLEDDGCTSTAGGVRGGGKS